MRARNRCACFDVIFELDGFVYRAVHGIQIDPCIVAIAGVCSEFLIRLKQEFDVGDDSWWIPVVIHVQTGIDADIVASHFDHEPFSLTHGMIE